MRACVCWPECPGMAVGYVSRQSLQDLCKSPGIVAGTHPQPAIGIGWNIAGSMRVSRRLVRLFR